jgi:SOS response regulatory protein OraA/RecX
MSCSPTIQAVKLYLSQKGVSEHLIKEFVENWVANWKEKEEKKYNRI